MIRNSSRNQMDNNNQCQECGCHCDSCVNNNSIHLHQEIEVLKQKLIEREQQCMTMESQILAHANRFPNGEMEALRDNLIQSQDKYERLLENHRKLQKVNQGLEDKLLRVADKFESEKIILIQNVNNLTKKLNEAQSLIQNQQKENLIYKNDYDLALKFIQSIKPINKDESIINMDLSLPQDFQDRANKHLETQQQQNLNNQNKINESNIRFPIPTFPPTAVLYSLNENNNANLDKDYSNTQSSSIPSSVLLQMIQDRSTKTKNLCQNCNEKLIENGSKQSTSSSLDNDNNFNHNNNYNLMKNQKNYENNKTIII